jgi:flagellar protein FlaG
LKEVTMQMQPIAAVATRELPDPDRTAAVAATKAAAAPATPARPNPAEPDHATLANAVEKLNTALRGMSQGLEFSIDQDTKRTVVKVIDQQTKEVIRQVPTQEVLEISKAIDRAQGLLIRQQA